MDLGVPQTLAAATGTNDLKALKQAAQNPAAARSAARQFGALLIQNLMRQSDGTALPMVGGTGSDVVNQMFAGTISRAVMAKDGTGLTELLLRSMEKKQQQVDGASSPGTSGTPASSPVAPQAGTTAATGAFPLAAYWQANGMRPLVAALAQAGLPPGAGAALALATQLNPKLAGSFGLGNVATNDAGHTVFPAANGHVTGGASPDEIAAFTQKLMPLLQQAGAQLGVSPKILLAQAAIETGWGRSVVGNNLFGIKAGSAWSGGTVTAATHEYESGELVPIVDAFRAYPSAEASVHDFVSLVRNSPRYRAALNAGENVAAYAQGLLSGGWATDIDYAHKLQSVAGSPAVAAATAALPPLAPAVPAAAVAATTAASSAAPGAPVALLPADFSNAGR